MAGGAADAVAQGGGAARFASARQQAFQEIAESVQAVHHFRALGVAGEELGVAAQGGSQHALVGFREAGFAGGFEEIPPGHGGFQLVAGSGARPA